MLGAVLAAVCLVAAVFVSCKKQPEPKLPSLVNITSSNCPACADIKPAVDKIKEDFKGRLKVIVYDTAKPEGAEKAAMFNIESTPTLIFLDEDGVEYFRSSSIRDPDIIAALINARGR